MKKRSLFLFSALCLLWLCAAPVFVPASGIRFTDVSDGYAFKQDIEWLTTRGYAQGTTNTTFSPDKQCSIQAILKMLWAYSGGEEYTDCPFIDVNDERFKHAAAWAYYNGIEMGSMNGKRQWKLNGSDDCTRLKAVIYLWIMAGRPDGYGKYAEQFKDIDHQGNGDSGVQRMAVGWAAANEIVNGKTDTLFAPYEACTRGHIAAFLHRYDTYVNGKN